MCNVIDVHTQDNLQYVFIRATSCALRFKVKAANDAHIALTQGNRERDPITELRIGGWSNTASSVRRNRRKPDRVEVQTPGILNSEEYVGIWVRWYNNYIATGLEGSDTPFMAFVDSSPHPIDHVGVRTGWGTTGSWKIEVSPILYKQLATKPLSGELRWVAMTTTDEIPLGAIVGGFENGEVLYIAQAMHHGSLQPCKYVPSLKCAVVSRYRENYRINTFAILCGENLKWVEMKGDKLPPHAFPGGATADRNILYIGRAFFGKDLIPGKICIQDKACYMSHGDPEEEQKLIEFEVLVVPGNMPEKLVWHAPGATRQISEIRLGRAIHRGRPFFRGIVHNPQRLLNIHF